MEWKVPKDGEWRIKKKFLLFPVYLEGKGKWLEYAKIKQVYNIAYGWINWRWVEDK